MTPLLWMMGVGSPVAAAGDGGPEIIVTGERVPRLLQDTPSSVSVITGDQLSALAAPDRLEQALTMVPNIQQGSGGEGPTLRGQDSSGPLRDLPAFLGGTRPRLTLEIDGRAVSYNELAYGLTSVWDVSRIEVYRSPQTTTHGRNSIAGGIFIQTRDPSTSWEGDARAIVGDARTRQESAVLSGPLIGDQLAIRVAGDVRRSRTSSKLTSPAIGIDENRDDFDQLRAKLLATPKFMPGARFELTYAHVWSQMPQIEGVRPPFRARRDPFATYGIFQTRVDSLTGTLEVPIASGLRNRTVTSYGKARIQRFAPSGFGEALTHGRDSSIESLFDWQPRDGFRALAGIHLLHSRLNQQIDLSATPLGRGAFADAQGSFGLFGEATWKPTSQLTIIGGIRHQADSQTRDGAMRGFGIPLMLDYRRSFTAWLPKASIAYEVARGISAGVLVEKATNPGGTTIDLARARAQEFAAESLWDAEVFTRASLAGGKLTVEANAFDYSIRNAQRPLNRVLATFRGPVSYVEIVNEPRAWSRGAEVELGWRPSNSWQFHAALGLLRTKITRASSPSDPLAGKQFQRSPRSSASADVEWRPFQRLRLTAQVKHNSGYFSDDAESATQRVDGSTTIDAKAEWRTAQISVFGYARNLLNEFHLTYYFPPTPSRPILATAGDPREAGLGLEWRF